MTRFIVINEQSIPVHITHAHRKSIQLRVKDSILWVRAPQKMSDRWIMDFIETKKSWISKQLIKKEKVYISAKEGWLILFNQKVMIGNDSVQTVLTRAYPTFMEMIESQCLTYADRLNVTITSIQIKSMKRSWGRAHASGKLVFATRLIHTDPRFIEAVCVHEVVHLVFMNHSSDFKKTCIRLCPQYLEWIKLET